MARKTTSKGDTTGTVDRLASQQRQVYHFFGEAMGYELVTGYVLPYAFSVTRTAKGDWLCTVRGTDGTDCYVYFAGGATPWDAQVKAANLAFMPGTVWRDDQYARGGPSLELVGWYEAARQRAVKRHEEKERRQAMRKQRQL